MPKRALAIGIAVIASLWVGTATAAALEVSVLNSPYNAKGNGTTNDRAAIQSAINDVNTAGGGKVILPATHTYLTGDLTLKSKVTLEIAKGAVLKQSQSPSDYAHKPHLGREIPEPPAPFMTYLDQNYPLIYAGKATEVTVTGGGEILLTREGGDASSVLVHGIGFFEVSHYVISNLTISSASGYNVTMRDTEFGEIKNVTTTKPSTLNSDGISLMNCRHIEVHNNNLTTLDDGIYVWASYDDPRRSEWWNSDTPRQSIDINVYENAVHDISTGASHGFLFINWTAAAPDQSQVEIARINVHDNSFEAYYPLGALNGDIYHTQSQKTPSKDLKFANNTLVQTGSSGIAHDLSGMATTDLSADSSVYNFGVSSNKSGLYNSNFDGQNAFSAEVGTSFWSVEGNASAPSTSVGQPSGRYGQIASFNNGYVGIYQGVFLEPGTYKFSAVTQTSGDQVRLFAIRASNLEVTNSLIMTNKSWETKSITFTVSVAGTYRLGIDDAGSGPATGFGRIDNAKIE